MTHRRFAAVAGLFALAGTIQTAAASTTMEVQVSRALAEDWHSSINAVSGDSIDIRVRVSYTGGSVTPIGFGALIFQPTVSNWLSGGDQFSPLVNGGAGGQQTTPIGAVPDAAGQYGRVMPYAYVGMPTTNRLRGFVNTNAGTTYLRIAQAPVSNWFGGAGNTSGGSGVNMLQLNQNNSARASFPVPAFESSLTNVVLFKFNITLSSSDFNPRTMVAATPLEGLFSQATGPYVGWYADPNEVVSSIRDVPTFVSANIFVNIPAPATLPLLGAAGVITRRRRRSAC